MKHPSVMLGLSYYLLTFAPDLKINSLTMLRQIMSISMISRIHSFMSCGMSRCAHSISCFFRRMPSDSSEVIVSVVRVCNHR